jgi:membrane protein implicated in regulation of membrane protease activity
MAVTPEMIAVALGVAAPASGSTQLAQWSMWIDDALLLIEHRLGDPALLDQAKLDYVVREAVVAHARRPDEATQVTTSVDDASSSRTYRTGKGRVTIADDLWALLSGPAARGRAFTVDTTPPGAGVGTYGVDYVWVSTTQTGPVP